MSLLKAIPWWCSSPTAEGVRTMHSNLRTNGPQLKSLPPKQPIALVHQANGDNCRAHIEERLSFGLHPYRMSPNGITVLLFNDYDLDVPL